MRLGRLWIGFRRRHVVTLCLSLLALLRMHVSAGGLARAGTTAMAGDTGNYSRGVRTLPAEGLLQSEWQGECLSWEENTGIFDPNEKGMSPICCTV